MRFLNALTVACVAAAVGCQASNAPSSDDSEATAPSQPDLSTAAGKIQDAMSAAPVAVASAATILDWPESDGAEPKQLRAGTNGWTCLPSDAPGIAAGKPDPMCVDAASMAFLNAYMTQSPPQISSVGFVYMLQGDAGSSNIDPWATAATSDNQWVVTGPHIMLVVPDPATLQDLPTDPSQGGPFVMWKGTPYAHVMVPTAR